MKILILFIGDVDDVSTVGEGGGVERGCLDILISDI